MTDEPPDWSEVDAETIEEHVVDLADQGHDPSVIGLKLRDEGIGGVPVPDVSLATGKSITEILDDHDAGPDIPEDLYHLMAKAVRLHEHLDANPTDYPNKRALQNAEAKVRRLVNYYRGDRLDEDFTYTYDRARELVE